MSAARPAPHANHPLPERVAAAIEAQQNASEILIGWVQLGIVVLFGALYALSPRALAEHGQLEPVPWTLSAYSAFTLLRLALAYRRALRPWMLHLSVIADIALLVALIWSFHLQYHQPPAFYLKAPTLLYVFIFIALRALRFEARYVVLAGLCAAAGWAGLAIYAVAAAGGKDVLTRDFVLYMTSNRVLIGAEIDKIISILTVTAVLAAAIGRARQLLERALVEGHAARALSRFFAPEIARTITTADAFARAGEGVAREAAILFVDLRGFSEFAVGMAPQRLMEVLAEYQRRMVPIIQRHNGAIDKFMGDGIMATFGAVRGSDTFAADALRTIEAVMEEARAWNAARRDAGQPELRVGAAAASGRIVFGAVGDASQLEYTVIGAAVNRAAKLEKHTKNEDVRALTDAATYAQARAQGFAPAADHEPRPACMVEGLREPVEVVVMAP